MYKTVFYGELQIADGEHAPDFRVDCFIVRIEKSQSPPCVRIYEIHMT